MLPKWLMGCVNKEASLRLLLKMAGHDSVVSVHTIKGSEINPLYPDLIPKPTFAR